MPNVVQEVFGVSPLSGRTTTPDILSDAADKFASVSPRKVRTPDGIVVGGQRNILLSFCRNCNALFGDDIQGVVSPGRGVKVHQRDCRYPVNSDPARRVDAIIWDEAAKTTKRTVVAEVIFEDSPGMLAEMSKAISSADVTIGGVGLTTLSNGQGVARFELVLSSIDDLKRVALQLGMEPGVISVQRK